MSSASPFPIPSTTRFRYPYEEEARAGISPTQYRRREQNLQPREREPLFRARASAPTPSSCPARHPFVRGGRSGLRRHRCRRVGRLHCGEAQQQQRHHERIARDPYRLERHEGPVLHALAGNRWQARRDLLSRGLYRLGSNRPDREAGDAHLDSARHQG